ncbi:MAG: hypothetical protein IPH13_21010 [Planctomycetes bacterium]|nr:hypothetical protein [Planctomycetota bacterium]
MASYNKKIYGKLKAQNERRDLMGGIAGLISGATQGYQREKSMQSADALGQQIGLPQGAGRVIPPGLIAQAMLNKQIAEQAQAARRADMEYQIGQQREMADAERAASQQRWVMEQGTRQDQFDQTMNWNRENAAQRAKSEMEALRFQEQQSNFRTGIQEVGDTLRGIGGGVKDIIVKGMSRGRDSNGVPYAERELVDNLDLQIKDAATQIQQDRLALGIIPNKDGFVIKQELSPEQRAMLEQRIAVRERQLASLQEQLRKVHSGVASRYGADLSAPMRAMQPQKTPQQMEDEFVARMLGSGAEQPIIVDPGQ